MNIREIVAIVIAFIFAVMVIFFIRTPKPSVETPPKPTHAEILKDIIERP
jgi:uncharacterized protein YoxC